MRTFLINLGSSALISLLLILPFMIMEVVNRRNYDEDFPVMLFFAMWFNLFAFILILLPIVRSWWAAKHDPADPFEEQRSSLLTNPRSSALISIALILIPGILPLLGSLGWLSLDRLINGPNPEQLYIPSLVISLGIISLSVAAGVIASLPIARTVRVGGRLFAHPINLIIVVFLLSTFAFGFASFIIDQWPCFIGVPVCD